jgi:hypothetical protein
MGTFSQRTVFTVSALGACLGLVVALATDCNPSGPPGGPGGNGNTPPPPVLTAAPCGPVFLTDIITEDGLDTRTGCMVVTMALGAVTGAADFSLSVSLVRNEGNPPPAKLYADSSWFGLGTWLSVDEYITNDGKDVYTLHTPRGDALYDAEVLLLPTKSSTSSVQYFGPVYRTRPFDGTLLIRNINDFWIAVGNPYDTRSLVKWYDAPFPGDDASSKTRILHKLTKASIYRGQENAITITRHYDENKAALEIGSDLYAGKLAIPFTVDGAQARSDGNAGFEVKAVTTLLHGYQSSVLARIKPNGNIEQLVSTGRNASETHQTAFTYANEDNAAQTIFETVVEKEGSTKDTRTLRSIELKPRADASSQAHPFAVQTMIDHTRPGADLTNIVSECSSKLPPSWGSKAQPSYLTVNFADGTGVGWEYGTPDARGQLVRTKDAYGKETRIMYNLARGGGDPGSSQPATAFELHYMEVQDDGASTWEPLYFRYDKFSAVQYKLPMLGKVSVSSGSADKQVLYRAVFGTIADKYNGNKPIMTYEVPRAVAGPDGRTRYEYRSLDGFTYETWDEDNVMTAFRWLDQDQNVNGKYDKETIETYVLGNDQTPGVKLSRVVRDSFGRTLQRVDYDPGPPAVAATTTYHVTPEGFTDRIDDTGTGETYDVTGWNDSRSGVTAATLSRGMQTVAAFSAPQDSFGNPDGQGTVTLGPITYKTSAAAVGAGLMQTMSVTGPNGQSSTATLGYADNDSAPNLWSLNGSAKHSSAPKAMTATGGCK